MRKDLFKRVAQLESLVEPKPGLLLVWVTHAIKTARKNCLADGERVVCDLYAWHSSGVAYGRERITTDPADEGRRCEEGGCLEDVVRELHLEDRHLGGRLDDNPEDMRGP